MGCCNQAPKGGSAKMGPLLKCTAVMAIALFLIVVLFG